MKEHVRSRLECKYYTLNIHNYKVKRVIPKEENLLEKHFSVIIDTTTTTTTTFYRV